MKQIISSFKYDGDPYSCEPYGKGHINSTYKVECKNGDKTMRYILQQINSNIFHDTAALMDNIENVTEFLNLNSRQNYPIHSSVSSAREA